MSQKLSQPKLMQRVSKKIQKNIQKQNDIEKEIKKLEKELNELLDQIDIRSERNQRTRALSNKATKIEIKIRRLEQKRDILFNHNEQNEINNETKNNIKIYKKKFIESVRKGIKNIKFYPEELELLGFKTKTQLIKYIIKNYDSLKKFEYLNDILEHIETNHYKAQNKKNFIANFIFYKKADRNQKGRRIYYQGIAYTQLVDPRQYLIKSRNILRFNETKSVRNDGDDFDDLVELLEPNKDFKNQIFIDYVDLIYTFDVHEEENINIQAAEFDIEDEPINNSEETSVVMHKYVAYDINHDATKLNELFKSPKCEYLRTNEIANSCFLSVIINTYNNDFNKKDRDGHKHIAADLTYEYLTTLCKIENKNQSIALTLNQSLAFFEKHRIGITVMDAYNTIAFEFYPNKFNHHVSESILYVMIKDNHVTKLNREILTLKHTKSKDIAAVTVSNKFYLAEENKYPKDLDLFVLNSMTDLVEIIKKSDTTQEKTIYCIYNESMNEAFMQLQDDHKITPFITFSNCTITTMKIIIRNLKINISAANFKTSADRILTIYDKETILKYWEQYNKFSTLLLNEDNISYHSDQVSSIEDKYTIAPIVGTLVNSKFTELNGIDESKAYTKKLCDMTMLPVFGFFDIFEEYDGHNIEQYTQYIVRCEDRTTEAKILFGSTFSRCYGNKLINMQGLVIINYQILYYRRPSRLVHNPASAFITELYSKTKLSDDSIEDLDLKKYIVNCIIGTMNKKNNNSERCQIYKTNKEACHYAVRHGGIVRRFNSVQELEDGTTVYRSPLFAHIMRSEARLINGFKPIGDYIYDAQRLTMCKRYIECLELNLNPIAIKTDCILLNNTVDKIQNSFDLIPRIGGYKLEINKTNCTKPLQFIYNNLVPIESFQPTVHEIKDEYDHDEIKKIFEKYNRVMVFGNLPGVGKSTCVKKLGASVLFSTPHNLLSQQIRRDGCDSITVNRLLGIYGDGQEFKNKMKIFDIENYETICFDEICMNDYNRLFQINKFMLNNQDKRFIATGDTYQLLPIFNGLNNISDMTKYYHRCYDIMFPDRIILEISKRLKEESEREKLLHLKLDIFDTKKDIMDIIRKYGFKIVSNMKDVKTKMNICYFQYRRDAVNNHVYKMVEKDIDKKNSFLIDDKLYSIGQKVICCEHQKLKGFTLNKNFEYTIQKISAASVTLYDEDVKESYNIDKSTFRRVCALPYCHTTHAVQGLTYSEPMTIFDCNLPYVDRNLIWTALTRATDLNNVQFFEHSKDEVARLTKSKILQKFNSMVDGYRSQDRRAKRDIIDKDFIIAEWIRDDFEKCKTCPVCKINYELYIDDGKVHTTLSVDRIDNKISHTKNNCRLTCADCNKAKSNHYQIKSN